MRPPQLWSKTRIPHVVRYRSGSYYLRAKIGGKVRRISLGTGIESQARLRAPRELERLRTLAAGKTLAKGAAPTLGDLVERFVAGKETAPDLKRNTGRYYRESVRALAGLDLDRPIRELSRAKVESWWGETVRKCSPTRANGGRIILRGAIRMAIDAGWISADPTVGTKHARPEAKKKKVPTSGEFREMLAEIAGRKTTGRRGREGNAEVPVLVALLGFAGLRVSEALAMRWEDIGADFLSVRGGEEGTKNREVREVPVMPALRPWLDSFRPELSRGRIFSIQSARAALKAYGLSHHSLRHMFATRALESGVDVRTVAGWLGHKDGGALLLKTYAHLLSGHSLAQASRVAF